MASIFETLDSTLKSAMLSRDQKTVDMIRSIKAKLIEYEVENSLDRSKVPNDGHMIKVLRTHKKSLEKAISQFKKGGRDSEPLVDLYKEEIKFCESYLPDIRAQEEAIVKVITEAMKSPDLRSVPALMKHIMSSNPHFDGGLVKDMVLKKLRR